MATIVDTPFPNLSRRAVENRQTIGKRLFQSRHVRKGLPLSASLSTLSTASGRFGSTESDLSASSGDCSQETAYNEEEGDLLQCEESSCSISAEHRETDGWTGCLTSSPSPMNTAESPTNVWEQNDRTSPPHKGLTKPCQHRPKPDNYDPPYQHLQPELSSPHRSSEAERLSNLLYSQAARGLCQFRADNLIRGSAPLIPWGLSYLITSTSSTLSRHQRPDGVKVEYNHYENAAIFISIVAKMIGKGAVQPGYPGSIFIRQAADPDLEKNCLIDRMALGMRCKYPCYVLAWSYLQRLNWLFESEISLTPETFQRLVVAATVVATKFYDDYFFSNEHYGRELGYPLETINKLEMSFLILLDFDLRIPANEFERAMLRFDELRVSTCDRIGVTAWSGLKTAGIPPNLVSIAALYNFLGSEKAAGVLQLDKDLSEVVQAYLSSREKSCKRFESEEECLHRIRAMAKVRDIKKLVDQFIDTKHAAKDKHKPHPIPPRMTPATSV